MLRFQKFLLRITNKSWKKLIFCCLLNLGLPIPFGFYWITEIPIKMRIGFVCIMLGLSFFEALVMWTDMCPAEK